MEDEKQISIAVIRRLPRYYRYLGDLLESGIKRVSSQELSTKMNVTASQIRQDFNNFGCFGQQGYGYNVEVLQQEIKKILGLDKSYNMIVVGAGNIGRALTNYSNFEKRGFKIIGIFDMDRELIGKRIRNIEIFSSEILEDFILNHHVDIAVLSLPSEHVADVAKLVIGAGAKGIWNFSHVDLEIPGDVMIENVHLTDSLMTLSYKLNQEGNA